jgi:hypothetical protein
MTHFWHPILILISIVVVGCSPNAYSTPYIKESLFLQPKINTVHILNLINLLYPKNLHATSNTNELQSDLSPCLLCMDENKVNMVFAPSIATSLNLDAASKDKLGECFGYGPLVDGQDYIIKDFHVDPIQFSGFSARTTIHFRSLGAQTKIPLEFTKLAGEWKVSDFGNINPILGYCHSQILNLN